MCSLNQTCKGSVGKQAVYTGTSVYFMVFFKLTTVRWHLTPGWANS